MSAAVKLVDETSSGKILNELVIEIFEPRIAAREIVERRVRHEVAAFEESVNTAVFRGLVQPKGAEREANGYRLRKSQSIDVEEQVQAACRAFETNGFLMLVGEHQVDSLDEEIAVKADMQVSFIKLVPLVGG